MIGAIILFVLSFVDWPWFKREQLISLITRLEDPKKGEVKDLVPNLTLLKQKLDTRDSKDYMNIIGNRAMFLHTALFICLHERAGEDDFKLFLGYCMQNEYIGTVQLCCAHIMRYMLACGFLMKSSTKEYKEFKGTLKTREPLDHVDILVEFYIALKLECNFQLAFDLIGKIYNEFENDYFLRPFRERIREACQNKFFKTYFKIFNSISFKYPFHLLTTKRSNEQKTLGVFGNIGRGGRDQDREFDSELEFERQD